MIQTKIAKCPRCDSTNLTFSTNQDKFICKECGYSGERIKESSKLEEERKRLMDVVLSSKTRNEIERALKKKGEMQRRWLFAIGAEEGFPSMPGFALTVGLMHTGTVLNQVCLV